LKDEIESHDINLNNSDLNEVIDDFDKISYFVLSQIEIQNQVQEELLDSFKSY
jgi:hypothetical protein